jgi:hypothetical protein
MRVRRLGRVKTKSSRISSTFLKRRVFGLRFRMKLEPASTAILGGAGTT